MVHGHALLLLTLDRAVMSRYVVMLVDRGHRMVEMPVLRCHVYEIARVCPKPVRDRASIMMLLALLVRNGLKGLRYYCSTSSCR